MSALRRAAGALLLTASAVSAQEYAPHEVPLEIPTPDIASELEAFELAEGFEIGLFKDNPAVVNPVSINWDARGRMWVAGSASYPHLRPGQRADDRIVILEDVDRDGHAESSIIFAHGLLVPHGVQPWRDGAFVCASTELLFLRDTDGDDRADERRIVLSGFGNEDVHHVIHTFTLDPLGYLYFNQSININSFVETARGRRRLDGSGFWKFDPRSERLEVFVRGIVNPWGHVVDPWGQHFATDGAGSQGIHYIFPGAALVTATRSRHILDGLNRGHPKYCGLAIWNGRHVPEAWRGRFLTNDFRANRIVSFEVGEEEESAGYFATQKEDLLKSSHVSFRPVDLQVGPDGALYVVDWYNPIIDHGEVDFHHPARDHSHGRIWRITASDRPPVEPPDLVDASIRELLDALRLPEPWTRSQARRQLWERDPKAVLAEIPQWTTAVIDGNPGNDRLLLEALWLSQACGRVDRLILESLLAHSSHRLRAAAVRVLSSAAIDGEEKLARCRRLIEDPHPLVRLETLRALGRLGTTPAARLVLSARGAADDRFLEHAQRLALGELAPQWLQDEVIAQLEESQEEALLFALFSVDDARCVAPLESMLSRGRLAIGPQRLEALRLVARRGDASAMRFALERVFSAPYLGDRARRDVLDELTDATRARGVRPRGELSRLAVLLEEKDVGLRAAAVSAIGVWKISSLGRRVRELAASKQQPLEVRRAAVSALAELADEPARRALDDLAAGAEPPALRAHAVISLARIDVKNAAVQAAALLGDASAEVDVASLVNAFVYREGGSGRLATALERVDLSQVVAEKAFEATRLGPDPDEDLLEVLRAAGGAPKDFEELTPDVLRRLRALVARQGVASRGEEVFRREALACFTCHAIGGAGGQVGPDLSTIGASSPVDYLIESILEPAAAVKEAYRTTSVILQDGTVVNGIKVADHGDRWTLRTAEGRERSVPVASILRSSDGPSLMPAGLVDPLGRDELVHLIRFLSELGRVGPFAVPSRPFVRRWRVWSPSPVAKASGPQVVPASFGLAEGEDASEGGVWRPVYSTVAGYLPLVDVASLGGVRVDNAPSDRVRFAVDVEARGAVSLWWNSIQGITSLEVDGEELSPEQPTRLEWEAGRHEVIVTIDRRSGQMDLRCEVLVPEGSKARAMPVGGP